MNEDKHNVLRRVQRLEAIVQELPAGETADQLREHLRELRRELVSVGIQ